MTVFPRIFLPGDCPSGTIFGSARDFPEIHGGLIRHSPICRIIRSKKRKIYVNGADLSDLTDLSDLGETISQAVQNKLGDMGKYGKIAELVRERIEEELEDEFDPDDIADELMDEIDVDSIRDQIIQQIKDSLK